jgi:SAM-dependent methyltransferase
MTWENEISRNALDVAPYKNVLKDAELIKKEELENISPDELNYYISKDNYPIPCQEDREHYCKNNDSRYWVFGLQDYLKVKGAAKELNKVYDKYLDFGCASGRVIRHFLCNEDIEIWGTDINQRHIRWIHEHLPKVKAIFNNTIPSLPFEDNYFDLITSFSVFTHIDTFETCWLAEIRRILKPSGMFYVTIHDETTWEENKKDPNSNQLKVIKIATKDNFEKIISGPPPCGMQSYRHTQEGPYRGLVFHSKEYIENVWGRFFKIIKYIPLGHKKQTVLILEK